MKYTNFTISQKNNKYNKDDDIEWMIEYIRNVECLDDAIENAIHYKKILQDKQDDKNIIIWVIMWILISLTIYII